jgi:hypothetical protein
MGAPISSMPGISADGMAARVFNRAGMPILESIRRENFPERRLSAALVTLRQSPEHEHLSRGHWHGLGSRCTSILRQVRNADADPYPPDAYCCPLSLCWLEDAVVTPQGYSFSRVVIEQSLEHQRLCPITRQPLDARQLVPNRQLQQAADHYRNHHMRLFPALRRP